MYVAKMSGYADAYDLFTPDLGELAFLADETAPHPFYTRGFLLAEEKDLPALMRRAQAHGNCPPNLIVKGRTDHIVCNGMLAATVDTPSVEAMECIGGTGRPGHRPGYGLSLRRAAHLPGQPGRRTRSAAAGPGLRPGPWLPDRPAAGAAAGDAGKGERFACGGRKTLKNFFLRQGTQKAYPGRDAEEMRSRLCCASGVCG